MDAKCWSEKQVSRCLKEVALDSSELLNSAQATRNRVSYTRWVRETSPLDKRRILFKKTVEDAVLLLCERNAVWLHLNIIANLRVLCSMFGLCF